MHFPISPEHYRVLKKKAKHARTKRRKERERSYAFQKREKYLKEKGEVINA
jgi:hypothetical protein